MALTDSHGRVHDYLRLSLIDKCNLRCTYCMPEDIRFLRQSLLMQPREMVDIASWFVEEFGVNKIRLTGGEPLLHPEAAWILEELGKLPVKLALTTNGLLLEPFLPQLEALGIRSINLSLDSLQRERFAAMTRRDELDKVLKALESALAAGFRVKLNVVVVNGVNTDELLDFVALTRDRDLHVRFIEFMPFDGNGWAWNKVFSYRKMMELIGAAGEVEKLSDKAHSTAKAYRVPGHVGTFAVISSVTDAFCSGCNRLRLTADGKLRNCLFAREETDLLAAWRRGEDLKPLVLGAMQQKAARLGGLPEFQDEDAVRDKISDRAMVRIGG